MDERIREGCLNHISDVGGFDAMRNAVLEPGHVVNRLSVPQNAANLFDTAHGGFLMTLLDETACMAGYSLGKSNMTLQSNFNFIAPPRVGDEIFICCDVIHDGTTTQVVDARIDDGKGAVFVKASFTLHIVAEVDPDAAVPEPYLGRIR